MHSHHVSWAANQPALCTNSSKNSPYRWICRINKVIWPAAKGTRASTGRRTQARAPTAACNSSLHLDGSSCLWNHTLKLAIPQRNSVLQTNRVSAITHQDSGGGKLCVCKSMSCYAIPTDIFLKWRILFEHLPLEPWFSNSYGFGLSVLTWRTGRVANRVPH